MTRKTHVAIGMAVIVPLVLSFGINSITALLGLIGATAPDLDIKYRLGHRTITHSIIAIIVTTAIASILGEDFALVWCACYSSHIVADSFTKNGVPVFYPLSKRTFGLKLIRTGGVCDKVVRILAYVVTILIIIRYFGIEFGVL